MGYASEPREYLRLFRYIGILLFGLQLIGLLVFSAFIYHRFTLGIDFGIYNQAASEISKGHFDPYSTIVGYSFIKSHFELIIWPLSFLLFIFRSSFVILVVQDIALVGTGLITFLWILALIESRNLAQRIACLILITTCVLILIDPLVYFTIALDFHTEALATFFAVFGAFDIWSGRHRRAFIWLALCLLCGDVGALYVVGVGLSTILSSSTTRRLGLILILVGVGWIGLISSLGANLGSLVTTQYAYLADRHTLPAGFGGAAAVIGGVIAHPSRPYDIIRDRLSTIGGYLLPGGVIGLMTAWGFGVPILVLLSSALQATPLFIGEPYQQFAVFPFILFGTISLLISLITIRQKSSSSDRKRLPSFARSLPAVFLAISALIGAFYYSSAKLPRAFVDNAVGGFIPGTEAASLRMILGQTPSNAEVIVSLPISGRFSGRKHVYLYLSTSTPIPIREKTVILVMDTAHTLQFVSPAQQVEAAHYVMTQFHAQSTAIGTNLRVLQWTSPSSMTSVRLP